MELSVVLAVKNGEKYIAEQLRSVQNQTYKNFECIIIDDHSTDDTVNIVLEQVVHLLNKEIKNETDDYIINHFNEVVDYKIKRVKKRIARNSISTEV